VPAGNPPDSVGLWFAFGPLERTSGCHATVKHVLELVVVRMRCRARYSKIALASSMQVCRRLELEQGWTHRGVGRVLDSASMREWWSHRPA
jgi:hypothetical protein